MTKLINGAIAGFVATLPMTAAMALLYRGLPATERYPLPPETIERRVIEHPLVKHELETPAHMLVTTLAHFGYGAASGVGYAAFADYVPMSPAVKGALHGLAVWAASYLGWLPALGVLRSATKQPTRRTLLMVGAHLVWGSATGLLADQLNRRDSA